MSTADQLAMGLTLGHEAHRDGISGQDNYLETRSAVTGHTEMAIRMLRDGQGLSMSANLQNDIGAYMMGQDVFNAYADGSYDSSGDYWKLMEDGSLAYDGDGWLKDSNGNFILDKNNQKIGADGIQGGLQKILGISDIAAVQMLKDQGFTLKDGNSWKHGDNSNKSITLGNESYAAIYTDSLSIHNTQVIYDNLVSTGKMEMNIGKDGFGMNFGMGGTDISMGTISKAIQGYKESSKVIDWKFGTKEQKADLNAINMLGWTGIAGNKANVNLSKDIWGGKLKTRYEDMDENDHGYYDRDQKADEIVLSTALLGSGKDAAAKLATVMGHEGTHVADNRIEAVAHLQGLATYDQITKIFGLTADSAFAQSMVDAINDPESWKENVGSRDNWKLAKGENDQWGWQEDGSLDFNIDLNDAEISSLLMNDPAMAIMIIGGVKSGKIEDGIVSVDYKNMTETMACFLGAALNINNPEGPYFTTPERAGYNFALESFATGTMAFSEVSAVAEKMMSGQLSQDNINALNVALMRAQNSGLLVKNSPGQIDTSRLINLGTENNPLYVPVELGPGQNVHETSSYPRYRLRNIKKGLTKHSGIDLRGIHDSNVVASANDSSVSLMYDDIFGLFAMNSYEYGGIQHKDQLSHLEAPQTVMAYLNNFGTEGVSFDGTTMTGIIAGTVLGNVGNTGDSEGAHLDWNIYENGKSPPVNPLKSKLYGEYLSTKITATTEALYLSGMTTKSIADNISKIEEYYKATKDRSFLMDFTWYHGIWF